MSPLLRALNGDTHSNADATEDMRKVLEAVRDRVQVLPRMRRQDWQRAEARQDCQKNVRTHAREFPAALQMSAAAHVGVCVCARKHVYVQMGC